MPLTKVGKKVLANMRKKYGERAEEVFHASINKGIPGSEKWHRKRGKKDRGRGRKGDGALGYKKLKGF